MRAAARWFRRFRGARYLARISSTIDCECPHHLARLLSSFTQFEEYSAQCENRRASDAEIHAYLHDRTVEARSIIEEALIVLMEFEGIVLNGE